MTAYQTVKICTSIVLFHFFAGAQITIPQMTHRLLVADEGNGKVHYIDLANSVDKWSVKCSNRDMQLVGSKRLMVSDNGGTGYSMVNLSNGSIIKHTALTGISSSINSAFRLSEAETFCAQDGTPSKIIKSDSAGKVVSTITISLNASVRICRPTAKGTFLIGGKVAGMIYEFDSTGKKVWETNAGGEPYMALRLPTGNTLISSGYGCQMVLADEHGTVLKRFPTDADKKNDPAFWSAAKPNFFAGFQLLQSGTIVVANWQGHGTGLGSSGFQLIEIDSGLTKVVAYWKQDESLVSSLHGVLVLDGLDTGLLYSDYNGVLQPLPASVEMHLPKPNAMHRARVKAPESIGVEAFDLQGRTVAVQHVPNCFYLRNSGGYVEAAISVHP